MTMMGQPRASYLGMSPFDDFVSEHRGTPRRGVFGAVVHEMGRRIVAGEFAEESTLPTEDALLARLRVSRSVFREVMKTLRAKGLVEIRTRTGTRVRSRSHWHLTDPDVMVWHYETGPSPAFLHDLMDLRRVLEPAAASRAARHATPAEIDAIRTAYAAMCDTVGLLREHARADQAFHAGIFAASHNLILGRSVDLIAIGIYGNTVMAPDTAVDGQRQSLPFHEAVLRAIATRDPAGAERAMHALLDDWRPSPWRVGRERIPARPLAAHES